KLIDATDLYRYNNEYGVYEDMSTNDSYMRTLYRNSETLTITGIVTNTEGSSSMALSPGVAYTKGLTQHVIEVAETSPLVKKQLENRDVDVFSGKGFDEKEEQASLDFEDMISIDQDALAKAFTVNIPKDLSFDPSESADTIMNISSKTADRLEESTGQVLGAVLALDAGVSRDMIDGYPLYLNSFTCETYADENDPSKGCLIPEGKEEDYITVKGVNLPKNTVVSVSEETSRSYIDHYWATASMELPEDMDLSALGNFDVRAVREIISPVSDQVFRKYMETVRGYADEYDNITLEALQAIPSAEIISSLMAEEGMTQTIYDQATGFTKQYMTMIIAAGIGEASAEIMKPMASLFREDLFKIDTDAFSKAFTFTMNQEDLSRLMEAMMKPGSTKSAKSNLLSLGYQDTNDPTSISFYFRDFEGKENFLNFLKTYNASVEEEKEIRYTDITGFLMSSVKTIVDSVSYVLIAFVSISLVVSSIMIAVITLISVMERTKEIGILRAMGASKRNVSSIFNAETFIIGLLSGLLGVGVSLLLLIPINYIIHTLTGNPDITAVLPVEGAIALVIISFVLTIIAGFIPSKSAARKDPVIALRTE
ncbi:MAG: ABC transporter permease, partial [Erysipelotrichaceae bacterium]|nr:ABC transporter permease [Erysipelotrichaceae bacterium]